MAPAAFYKSLFWDTLYEVVFNSENLSFSSRVRYDLKEHHVLEGLDKENAFYRSGGASTQPLQLF